MYFERIGSQFCSKNQMVWNLWNEITHTCKYVHNRACVDISYDDVKVYYWNFKKNEPPRDRHFSVLASTHLVDVVVVHENTALYLPTPLYMCLEPPTMGHPYYFGWLRNNNVDSKTYYEK